MARPVRDGLVAGGGVGGGSFQWWVGSVGDVVVEGEREASPAQCVGTGRLEPGEAEEI